MRLHEVSNKVSNLYSALTVIISKALGVLLEREVKMF